MIEYVDFAEFMALIGLVIWFASWRKDVEYALKDLDTDVEDVRKDISMIVSAVSEDDDVSK